jgi:hypothetical protein
MVGGGSPARTAGGTKIGVMWVDESPDVPTGALAVLDSDGERDFEVTIGSEVALDGAPYTVTALRHDEAGFPCAVLSPPGRATGVDPG